MWRDGEDIQGWVSVFHSDLPVSYSTQKHTQNVKKPLVAVHLCISAPITDVWSRDIIVTLLAGWRPHNSPCVEAPGAAVLSESSVASRGLQTRFTFKLSLMWKSLPGATAPFRAQVVDNKTIFQRDELTNCGMWDAAFILWKVMHPRATHAEGFTASSGPLKLFTVTEPH